MSSRYNVQQQNVEGGSPAAFDIEDESEQNYSPDYQMETPEYNRDSGPLADNGEIVDIKMIGVQLRQGLQKTNEEEMKDAGGPHHSHFEQNVIIEDEALRGGPQRSYSLPIKYKVVIFTLFVLSAILVIITIVQGVRLSKIRKLTKVAELDLEEEFDAFKLIYKRKYNSSSEELERFTIFTINIMMYDQMFRKSKVKPERYFSEYSDLTNAEVEQKLGYNLQQSLIQGSNLANYTEFNEKNLAKKINWRDRGFVIDAKDQGDCGISYIFAVVGAIESHLMIAKNQSQKPFSEQHVLNCLSETLQGPKKKCESGTEIEVLQYAKQYGLNFQNSINYTGVPAKCTQKSGQVKIAGFSQIPPSNVTQLKAALNRGPVTAAIDSQVIYLLTRVVMPETYSIDSYLPCSKGNPSVIVLLIGYDEEHFIVKGSWGTKIAEEGFFRIKIGGDGYGVCGVLSRNFMPIMM